MKSALLLTAACLFPLMSHAQTGGGSAGAQDSAPAAPTASGAATPQTATNAATANVQEPVSSGEIIITATRRADRLSNVPIAVSVVTAAQLQLTGATDIRQLNQLSPSLLVSSTSSEAGAGVARVRGIGTVGDNPGLESSVATFIDGVYRNRSGVALSELGAIDRIEVLRGPQGTLFGRNASAGLINIVTQKPSFDTSGYATFEYGNYDYYRGEAGFTGPIFGDKLAARLDGVYVSRQGFNRDFYSGRRFNDRDRYVIRGQLLWRPTSDIDVRIIGDYAHRNEQCCSAIYAPLVDRQRAAGTAAGQIGDISLQPASFASFLRTRFDTAGNRAFLSDDGERRDVSVSPGRDYQSDVTDWGGSGEVNWRLGGVNLTSITAYRKYEFLRGQDADFNNLDLLYRAGYKQQFDTFTQELRAQGELFGGRVNWLVGGFYANEDLRLRDTLRFGSQFGGLADFTIGQALAPLGIPFQALGGFGNLRGVVSALVPAAARPLIAPLIPNINLNDVGENDQYKQNSENFAIFTHNEFKLIDRVTLTLGGRYTDETKTLRANLTSDNPGCAAIIQAARNVAALGPAFATVAGLLNSIRSIPCLVNLNTTVDGQYRDRRHEGEFTGTAVLSWKPVDSVLVYGSYSRGYKAGGFNLDRAALAPAAPSATQLQFVPETVNAYEAGLKFAKRRFTFNAALFRQDFENFQLNTFNGINFIVENVQACSVALGTPAAGAVLGACPAGKTRAGVRSQGFELETSVTPVRYVAVTGGLTYAETKYRERLTGVGGRAIVNDLFVLPGSRLSNAPEYVVTGSVAYTPPIGTTGFSALFYIDARLQSEINTGSDLDIEKLQRDFVLTNARVGVRGPGGRFSVEFWGQNVFDTKYTQVGFDAPLQPIGGIAGARVTNRPVGSTLAANRSSALFGRYLGEPRTFGLTLRTKF